MPGGLKGAAHTGHGGRTFAALALLAAFCCAALAPPASAAAPKLVPGSRYLALGDSVTFGYMEPQVVPPPNYRNAASLLGYPEHLGAILHVRVTNAACPGETSSSLINPAAVSFGCENILGRPPGYRTVFPLHIRYRSSQLAFAIRYLRTHPGVRLVSLMVGANDLFVCQRTTRDGCASSSERRAVFARLTRNVRTILSAIRNKARYRGQLAIVNYYSLNYASAFISGASRQLGATVDGAARRFHVVIANGYAEFGKGSLHSAGNPCAAGLLTQLGTPGRCGVHPSYAGQALLADALAKVIRR